MFATSRPGLLFAGRPPAFFFVWDARPPTPSCICCVVHGTLHVCKQLNCLASGWRASDVMRTCEYHDGVQKIVCACVGQIGGNMLCDQSCDVAARTRASFVSEDGVHQTCMLCARALCWFVAHVVHHISLSMKSNICNQIYLLDPSTHV